MPRITVIKEATMFGINGVLLSDNSFLSERQKSIVPGRKSLLAAGFDEGNPQHRIFQKADCYASYNRLNKKWTMQTIKG